MFEHFADYMYYLLTAAFKRVRKSCNHWYTLFKVLGNLFDEVKDAFFTAREEGMVATCRQITLPIHGNDRGLTRYTGEELENFRSRIALYEETCRLGGTNAGIILAVKKLGYNNPFIKNAKEFKRDAERWAEFYLIIVMNNDEQHPISFDILRKTVRQWKEVGAKDNYYMEYNTSIKEKYTSAFLKVEYKKFAYFYDYLKLNGLWSLTGSRVLDAQRMKYPATQFYRVNVGNKENITITWHEEHNLIFTDGTWNIDGRKILDAYQKTEVL